MYAQSLLGSVRTVECDIDAVLGAAHAGCDPRTVERAVDIRATLRDVGEQLRCRTPHPHWREPAESAEDTAVATVLDHLYVGAGTVNTLKDALDDGESGLRRLADADRIERVDDVVTVPLVGDAGRHNWRVLVDILDDTLEALTEKAGRVSARLSADGVDDEDRSVRLWRAIFEWLEGLRAVLGTVAREMGYMRRRTGERARKAQLLTNALRGVTLE